MADSKWSEQKVEHLKSKTKSCQLKKTITDVEGIFQQSAWKLP